MISKERLQKHLDTLAAIGKREDGFYRLAFTDDDWQGRDYLIGEMKKAGLSIRVDAFGNVIARREGTDASADAPAVLYGSHADSVPGGGNFDGIVGTLCALEVMTSLQEDGFANELPLEQILFMCEESSRFGAATLGSRAMRDELTIDDLHLGDHILQLSRGLQLDAVDRQDEVAVLHDGVVSVVDIHAEVRQDLRQARY